MSVAGLALSPLLFVLGALASALTRDAKPLIVVRLLIGYFAYELATLLACGALWLAAGGGLLIARPRFASLHWRLLRWYIDGAATQTLSVLGITVGHEPSPEAEAALAADRPLLAFSRHAGPADTVLIADRLLSEFDRRPSVVFKQALAIDPCVDLLSHRLPHAVLDTSDRDECEREIVRVTAQLGRRGVLLLFPEGGNFSPERRGGAVEKLRRTGRTRDAAKAEEMSHVLPPHPSGALTALAAAPAADVIFAAHTGLGLAASPRQVWRELPIGATLRTRMWLVPAAEVPRQPDAQSEWLYEWWKRIDEWIASAGGL
jgi:1-acyl-sn-glycerol-3-phosphate acyltransferase